MKSDFSFLSFIKKQDKKIIILLIGALALVILLFPTSNQGAKEETPPDEEARIEELCSKIEGVGECRVMITYDPDSREELVYAVLVLCEGADSASVRERITSSLSSVYGIGSHRIEIQKLNR